MSLNSTYNKIIYLFSIIFFSCQSDTQIINHQLNLTGISLKNNFEIISFEEGVVGLTDWEYNVKLLISEKDINSISEFICENRDSTCLFQDSLYSDFHLPNESSYYLMYIKIYKEKQLLIYRFYDEG